MERGNKKACLGFSWADEVEEWEEHHKGRDVGRSDSKPDPFGSARPREVVLEEKGVDWRKIDHDLYHKNSTIRKENKQKKNISSSASRCQDQRRIQAQNVSPYVPPLRCLPKNIMASSEQMRSNLHSSAIRCIPNDSMKDSRCKRKYTGETHSYVPRQGLADMNMDRRMMMDQREDAEQYNCARALEWEDVYKMYAARGSNYKDKRKLASTQRSLYQLRMQRKTSK